VVRGAYEDASPRFQVTLLAARFAEHLRDSRHVRGPETETLRDVLSLAGNLPPASLQAPEAQELISLVREAARLRGNADR
jgi:hypothetical protein